ncbi:HAD family phosphatase [Sedimentibacter sp. zth1]|uniref:Cof-type HAD-IIB family hydrolase n=1 Tax=Sedimentibacter sp. zth1 TaxID=2816908 RepID=UPI001A929EA4|nr:Cof-type HAD-IIB family hydrolase [Sedimentibacter sp. zth1]QSX05368.1 HAD family phosphatase [Sedimentibacter sp. zth1]
MYKLIAVDLDDTLLKDDLTISDNNKKAIKKAIDKGVIFTLATGRVTKSAVNIAKELNLQVPIITFQGATIHNHMTSKNIIEEYLMVEDVYKIIDFAQLNNIHCNLYDNSCIYVAKENKWSDYYRTLSKGSNLKAVGNLLDSGLKSTPKMILIDEVENIEKIRHEVEKLNIENINIFTSKPNFLEITLANASKGHALERYAKMFNIKKEEVIAIGDSFNDLTMIGYAGLGVCMENGKEDIKDISDYITLSNENDGVANVIEKFIF